MNVTMMSRLKVTMAKYPELDLDIQIQLSLPHRVYLTLHKGHMRDMAVMDRREAHRMFWFVNRQLARAERAKSFVTYWTK